MLTFRNTSIAFLILLALFSLLSMSAGSGYWMIALPVAAYIGMLVFGSVFVCSGFYLKAFCEKETTEKVIALTFDDGPDPEVSPRVLDLLKEHGVKAVFFCIGEKVGNNRDIVTRMMEEGHLIGNHSYAHSALFDLWSSRQMAGDIHRAEEIIALATGKRPVWFRPPFGVTNPTVATVINRTGYHVMGWSIRSLDTSIKDPAKIMERIKKRWHPGGIILLHDRHERTLEVLERILEHAKETGYSFQRADRMISY